MGFIRSILVCSAFLVVFYALSTAVLAQEFTSNNFRVLDPVITPGGYATSTDYTLTGVITQIAIGTSTDTSFKVNSGFLFFPFVSTPVVTATGGQDGQVPLSWTSSSGFLGWTVTSYIVGQSTTSAGPYTYTDVGNVTSSTRTGLTNGTTYYFVIKPADAFGNGIATSTEVSATPAAGTPSPSPSPSGGGGGGGGASSGATINIKGRAYPRSAVTILKDAQIAATTVAGPDASFSVQISNVNPGSYIFSMYVEDSLGRRSGLLTFPVSLTSGTTANVGGIFLAPTIAVDKSEARRGDNIAIFGQSVSNADITIAVNSEEERFVKTKTDSDGAYLYNFDTADLENGSHITKAKAAKEGEISSFGAAVSFLVGSKNVAVPASAPKIIKGDVNGDGRVNLKDFSITAFWWKRELTDSARVNVDAKLHLDGKIDLKDFSVMAYYWTG